MRPSAARSSEQSTPSSSSRRRSLGRFVYDHALPTISDTVIRDPLLTGPTDALEAAAESEDERTIATIPNLIGPRVADGTGTGQRVAWAKM